MCGDVLLSVVQSAQQSLVSCIISSHMVRAHYFFSFFLFLKKCHYIENCFMQPEFNNGHLSPGNFLFLKRETDCLHFALF